MHELTIAPAGLSPCEFRLLDEYQHGFPLFSAPFARIADEVGSDESSVLAAFSTFQVTGRVSRIGAVFAPRRIGASTLAAMAVPPSRLAEVAAIVSNFAGVNHNYEREHRFNLWFVVTASTADRLDETLVAIRVACGLPLLRLPLEEEFHIDLGFALAPAVRALRRAHSSSPVDIPRQPRVAPPLADPLDAGGRALVSQLQHGLPLVRRPYRSVGDVLGVPEEEVLARIRAWLDSGILKRFGVVVRHHELGYTANAMLVHNVPDALVGEVGRRLATDPAVTLCYRRPRVLPEWSYNLFCMIHGQKRDDVERQIDALRRAHGLDDFPHAVLFSRTRFKQRGARYVDDIRR
jgi:siroheme decarboxylase